MSHDIEYWERVNQDAILTAIQKCEDAARQLISINSLTTTIYIGIISFGEVLKQPLEIRPALLFLLLPLPFWLASLTLATRVVIPRAYAVRQIREDYVRISRVKYTHLQWSYAMLILSLIILVAVIAIYLLRVPPPPAM